MLVAPVAVAYPDPDAAPRYHDSACGPQHDKRFVFDYLGMVAPDHGRRLEGAACEVYATTSAHFVLVTVPHTEGEMLENYALHLFEAWSVGDRERHDGLMLLYVGDYLASGSSALRIEVGYGLEGVVNSVVTAHAWALMVETRDEALQRGDAPERARMLALAAGSAYLLETLLNGHTDGGFPEPTPASTGVPPWFFVLVILVALVLVVALESAARGSRGWGYRANSGGWAVALLADLLLRGGGGGFGGGRSGGGGKGGRF